MNRIKSINWKFVVYWFVVMSITNICIIPKFVDKEPITTKRIIVGLAVSFITGIIMGLISVSKAKDRTE